MASLQKIILSVVFGLTLVSCGGGGSGSGGTILTGGALAGADEGATFTASISLTPVDIEFDTPAEVVVTVVDGDTPVANAAITFTASIGVLSPNEGKLFTDAEGIATATLTVPRASETGAIQADVSVGNDTITTESITYIVSFDPPILELELLDGSGLSTNDLTGFEQADVIVTLRNTDGPIVGEIVTLITGAGTTLGQASGLTDDEGQIRTTLTATDISAAGSLSASSTLDLTTVNASINYRVNELDPGVGSVNLQFTVDEVTIAPLTLSKARIVVTENDAAKTPIEGATVIFSTQSSMVEMVPASGSVFTNADGVAEIDISAGGVSGSTQIDVEVVIGEETFSAPSINLIVAEAIIEITISDNVVQANEVIEVTAQLIEATAARTPIVDAVIEFSTNIGTFAPASGLTDENGIVILEMTGGADPGEGTITASASVGGNAVTGTANFQNVGQQSSGDNRLELAASGMVDSSGDPDNVLAGNETALITVTVTEDDVLAEGISVLFATNQGQLSSETATTVAGIATVNLTGAGVAGVAIVTASANLTNGLQVEGTITVSTSSEQPTLSLVDSVGAQLENVELSAAESTTVIALVQDWNGDRVEDLGVTLTATSVSQDVESGKTVNGEVPVVLTGLQTPSTGTLTAAATFGTFPLQDAISVTSLGVNPASDNISIDEASLETALGANTVLDGNEKVDVAAIVTENGALKEGIAVLFSSTGVGAATLESTSDVTDVSGVASVRMVGLGIAGTTDITVQATLGNGITVNQTITVQTSATQPTIDLVVRDSAGVAVDTFGANQTLTLEATLLDFDSSELSAEDEGQSVTFEINAVTELATFDLAATDVTDKSACPANGVKQTPDCAIVTITSSPNSVVGNIVAKATINNVLIEDTEVLTNTGANSGGPDQNSFTITVGGEAVTDIVAIEGDEYNNETVGIRVDLADFFNNPVPDGTLVEFTTELGDVTPSCATGGGFCDVVFTSSNPRTLSNSEVSFRNLDDDACPSPHIADEIVTTATVSGDVVGLTEYRVSEVLRVVETGGDQVVDFNVDVTVLTEGAANDYIVTSGGIQCVTCAAGTELAIAYQRLWLDEEDDGSTDHKLLNPGVATAPFLPLTGIPCLAPARGNLIEIAGSVDPAASTTVDNTSGTQFRKELSVRDFIKISGEVREVTAIASDSSLTVNLPFSDNLNDLSPERIAAPAYLGGLGQPYGGRSTVIAYAIGEESFVDTNGNDEYDFGESFFDQGEAFLDKNEDGVLGDRDGNSGTNSDIGPYNDSATLGSVPDGEARDKSNPYCYGPETIVELNDGVNDSTEASLYCYQDGGEEEIFLDYDGDGLMDIGNGIYNGSRCLTPLQDADGGGVADDVVCTTDLINISRTVQIIMAGSFSPISFRSGGELISSIVPSGGVVLGEQVSNGNFQNEDDWTADATVDIAAGVATVNAAAVPTDLLVQADVFQSGRTHNVFLEVTAFTSGSFDIQAGGNTVATCDITIGIGGVGTCFTVGVTDVGDLTIVSAGGFVGTIDDISVVATTTGQASNYAGISTNSNDNTTVLTEFNVGATLDNATVFPGISDRAGAALSTTIPSFTVHLTDQYGGRLPDGTTVTVQSDNSAGCGLTGVGGKIVIPPELPAGGSHSENLNVGSEVGTSFGVSVAAGVGSGSINVTASTPIGNTSSASISCGL